jgi:hypothetical protein
VYQYPSVPKRIVEEWIGTSEWEGDLASVSPDAVVDFSADVPKRNTIVAAFKVCLNRFPVYVC